jgi:hypothetical protein
MPREEEYPTPRELEEFREREGADWFDVFAEPMACEPVASGETTRIAAARRALAMTKATPAWEVYARWPIARGSGSTLGAIATLRDAQQAAGIPVRVRIDGDALVLEVPEGTTAAEPWDAADRADADRAHRLAEEAAAA